MSRAHSHYFKNVTHLHTIDVYRVLDLFAVHNAAIAHAAKKLLVAGGRGAGKDIHKDVQEAIDTLVRWQEMQKEDSIIQPKNDDHGYMRPGNHPPPMPVGMANAAIKRGDDAELAARAECF